MFALPSCLVVPPIDHIDEKSDRRNENAMGSLLYLQKEEKGNKKETPVARRKRARHEETLGSD